MRVIVFVSGTGGNLKTVIDLSLRKPLLIEVGLVVSDRLGIKAIDIAKKHKIPVIAIDFEKECGTWEECRRNRKTAKSYQACAVDFHDSILQKIISIEHKTKKHFDFVVLSYHRWIHGGLLDYFHERIINQHAGDLTAMKNNGKTRKYIGINPVLYALKNGEKRTRTSTFLVRSGHDSGEILCQGPWVEYAGSFPITKKSAYIHELTQKRDSDWTALKFVLENIGLGRFGLARNNCHQDGCVVVTYDGKALPYGGIDLS